MLKKKFLFILLCFFTFILACSCTQEVEPKYDVSVTIDDSLYKVSDVDIYSNGKAESDFIISYIKVEALGPNGLSFTTKLNYDEDRLTWRLTELVNGEWEFYATAYNAKEDKVVSGSTSVDISTSFNIKITLNNFGKMEIREEIKAKFDFTSVDNPRKTKRA